MGKRTIRIPGNKLTTQLQDLPGKSAQVIMFGGITHAGKVESAEATHIVISDANGEWTNRKRHLQSLPITDIQFLILDVISSW
jgi:hypothetical protein